MKVITTELPGVVVLEPTRFRDDRGFFFESFNEARYARAGLPSRFVQDNISYSEPGVLRGLHYQLPNPREALQCPSRRGFRRGRRHPQGIADLRQVDRRHPRVLGTAARFISPRGSPMAFW